MEQKKKKPTLMHSMATLCVSTTIASIFRPKATVTATLYLRFIGLHKSNSLPWTPVWCLY